VRLLASGILLALAFPPFRHLGPVALVALVPFLDAVRLAEASPGGRRAASGMLYLGGVFLWALLVYWVIFVPPEEITVPWVIYLALGLMAGYLGLFVFAAQAAARRGHRLGVPLWLGFGVAWVGTEYLRSQSQLGFPWTLVGYALIEHPVLLQFLSLTGIFGASLFVVLVNGLVHGALVARPAGRRACFAAGAAVLVAAAYGHGRWAMAELEPARTLDVLLVQGNIGHAIKFKPEYRLPNVERMVELSEQAVAGGGAPRPDLVIWPETAAPCYARFDPGCRGRLVGLVERTGVPLLTGAPDRQPAPGGGERHWNAAFLFVPGRGLAGRYDKVNLVPFGEAVPYQDDIELFQRVNFGEADFNRGPGFQPLAIDGARLGVMICFESIFPAIGRAYASAGADFLVNITNDEWFGPSGGPYQHAMMAVARSIECRRGLARAANTGITFVVDRAGRVHGATTLYTEAVLRAPVELGSGETVYMRIGDAIPALCLAATVAMGVAGHRRPPRPAVPSPGAAGPVPGHGAGGAHS
jgi:apolipoprotein N-acyltransferase